MLTEQKMDFWIETNQNVLLIGHKGVGKSLRTIEAFNKHNLKWIYFSAPTMDPWVDFVGIPKEHTDENGVTYLELIRPKHFAYDDVEAIFLDEYNRSSEKVRNAVMELIQFKSINGKKFNNLRFIWASINPEDDISTYDVQRLDPAQKDRFQVWIDVPYECSLDYFTEKYKDKALVDGAIGFWNGLNETVKNMVSPRRLDYALEMYMRGGDVRDVLPKECNPAHFTSSLSKGSLQSRINYIINNNDVAAANAIMKNDSDYFEVLKYITDDIVMCKFFLPIMTEEKLKALITTYAEDKDKLTNIMSCRYLPNIEPVIKSMYDDENLKHKCVEASPKLSTDKPYGTKAKIYSPKAKYIKDFYEKINTFNKNTKTTLGERKEMYAYVKENYSSDCKNVDHLVSFQFFKKCVFKPQNEQHVSKLYPVNVEELHSEFPQILELINLNLSALAIDIRSCEIENVFNNKIIQYGLEESIWVPAT